MAEAKKTCWVLSDGRRGMENQCLGLAEALAERIPGLQIAVKRIAPRAPWSWLPESVFGRPWPFPFLALGKEFFRFENFGALHVTDFRRDVLDRTCNDA